MFGWGDVGWAQVGGLRGKDLELFFLGCRQGAPGTGQGAGGGDFSEHLDLLGKLEFGDVLEREHRRGSGQPYGKFACRNQLG